MCVSVCLCLCVWVCVCVGVEGGGDFFGIENWGQIYSLERKMWGPGLLGAVAILTHEIGGPRVFFDRENPPNPARVPCKFWSVPL